MTLERPRQDEAEKAVLGAVLAQNAALFQVSSRLKPEHFAHPHHGSIWTAMLSLAQSDQPIEIVTLMAALGARREEIGAGYVMRLVDGVPRDTNLEYYADLVIDAAKRRSVMDEAARLIAAAAAADAKSVEVIEQAQAVFFELSAGATRQTLWSATEMTAELFRQMEAGDGVPMGVATGIADLDDHLRGFQKGDLVVIGGRPSTGKTAIGIQMALHAAETTPVLVVSAEMGRRPVWFRALANQTRMSSYALARSRHWSDVDQRRIGDGLARLGNLRLWLDESPRATDMHVLSTARRIQMQHGLGLVLVDYLQLLQPADRSVRYGSRNEEIGAVARSLKGIARTLDVPVVVLASLNRDAANGRPTMANIRECGSVEYDADVILLMHRDVQAQKDAPIGSPLPAELIIEKQRNGPTVPIPLMYFGDQYRFESQVRA